MCDVRQFGNAFLFVFAFASHALAPWPDMMDDAVCARQLCTTTKRIYCVLWSDEMLHGIMAYMSAAIGTLRGKLELFKRHIRCLGWERNWTYVLMACTFCTSAVRCGKHRNKCKMQAFCHICGMEAVLVIALAERCVLHYWPDGVRWHSLRIQTAMKFAHIQDIQFSLIPVVRMRSSLSLPRW